MYLHILLIERCHRRAYAPCIVESTFSPEGASLRRDCRAPGFEFRGSPRTSLYFVAALDLHLPLRVGRCHARACAPCFFEGSLSPMGAPLSRDCRACGFKLRGSPRTSLYFGATLDLHLPLLVGRCHARACAPCFFEGSLSPMGAPLSRVCRACGFKYRGSPRTFLPYLPTR